MLTVTNLKQGQLGEFLVAAHLVELGHDVSFAQGACRYDLISVINDKIFRIQVKTCAKPHKDFRYVFGTRKRYKENAFDLIACVALDIKCVAFLPPKYLENKWRVSLRIPGKERGNGIKRDFTIVDCTLEKALSEI